MFYQFFFYYLNERLYNMNKITSFSRNKGELVFYNFDESLD